MKKHHHILSKITRFFFACIECLEGTLQCAGYANGATIIASPFHGSVLSAGFSPRMFAVLPIRERREGLLSDTTNPYLWDTLPSDVRFEANSLTKPLRESALFSLMTIPQDSYETIITWEHTGTFTLDARSHPDFPDQIICNFFFALLIVCFFSSFLDSYSSLRNFFFWGDLN